MNKASIPKVIVATFVGLALTFFANTVIAAGGIVTGPNEIAPDRYVYYPGTEQLAKDEIRVVACGTGMPAARRGQAATCFLVETGNGDKFIFDIGSGSMANLAALTRSSSRTCTPIIWATSMPCGPVAGQRAVLIHSGSGGRAA
jgi:hypothetical protein